eukprot:GAHX01007481.1.p1 GENE.GAHX01007481.1~~GAHX01007481.1.p1  ORF type:complete len:92 (-),score=24.61 GAHX01007481.1:61-336(-)
MGEYMGNKGDVRKRIQERAEEGNKNTNENRNTNSIWEKGQMVYVKAKNTKKLDDKWNGPFEVIDKRADSNSLLIETEHRKEWINIKQLKKA